MFKLSKEGIDFVKKEIRRYETKLSAVVPCLYRVQKENGNWISPECVTYLSQLMELEESQVYEVLSFYTMFNKKPVGKLHIQVCCNISCAMQGSRKLLKDLENQFSKQKEKTLCTFTPVECLGSCDTAPVVQINQEPYIEKTTLQKISEVIKKRICNGK